MTVPVWAPGGHWAAAVAELPRSTRLAQELAGSIVVIDGDAGWGSRVVRALDDGATMIVLSDPRSRATDEFVRVRQSARPARVIVDRPRLRSDVIERLSGSPDPSLVEVEAGASNDDLDLVLRDGIGWARSLAGGMPAPTSARQTPRGLVALLESPGRPLATVLASRRDGVAPWLRVTGLAPQRTEIVVGGALDETVVTLTTHEGALRLPSFWESHRRVALRRALTALAEDSIPLDLAQLEHDTVCAAEVLGL